MKLRWCFLLPWSRCSATAEHDILTPWRNGRDQNLESSPDPGSIGVEKTPKFTYPACQPALPVDTPCKYRIVVGIADAMDEATMQMVDAWMDFMHSSTDSEVFQVYGRQCAIIWDKRMIHIHLPRPDQHRHSHRRNRASERPLFQANESQTDSRALSDTEANAQDGEYPVETRPQSARHGNDSPDAMVAFFCHPHSYHQLVDFGQSLGITRAFFMHHTTLSKNLPHSYAWSSKEELFQLDLLHVWNIHRVEMAYQCSYVLPQGVPVVYVDPKNASRHCTCKCPDGWDLNVRHGQHFCEQVEPTSTSCSHNHRSFYYDITPRDHDSRNQCLIRNVTPEPISHVPYPPHNLSNHSGVLLHVETYHGKVIYSRTEPWMPPRRRLELLKDVSFTEPGVYLIRSGWPHETTPACEACLAISDKFRPQSRAKCPEETLSDLPPLRRGDRDIPTAEYTPQNLLAINAIFQRHSLYSMDVENDSCSEERCDATIYARQDFFQDDIQVGNYTDGPSCFADHVSSFALQRLQMSPFGDQNERVQLRFPVPHGQCTRCCHLEVELREWWVDYTCPATSGAPARTCSGNGVPCRTEQCLVGHGSTFFSASATVHPSLQAKTMSLVTLLYPDLVIDASREVHVLLECSEFGQTDHGVCSFETTIRHFVVLTAALKDRTVVDGDDDMTFVYWRYRVVQDDTSWRRSLDVHELQFDRPKTTIEWEAWSQCGLVASFSIHVVLHLTAPICTADVVDQMWYQASTPGERRADVLYPYSKQSAFAELTMDFDARMGLLACDLQRQVVPQWISTAVHCWAQFDDRSPALLVAFEGRNKSQVERFAIAMDERAGEVLHISCNFTYVHVYTRHLEQIISATKRFRLARPDHDSIAFIDAEDKCPPDAAALFQVCGGTFVHADGTSTNVTNATRKCCGDAVCAPLFSVGDRSQDLFQCVFGEENGTPQVLLTASSSHLDGVSNGLAILALCVLVVVGGYVARQRSTRRCRDDYELYCDA
ncbi:hypothetical protein Ae201684P_008217 [Aphanomyces euteiches]|uniref:Uncharacterized protein n=2 Tax=Aphanomyces euteiches TaxID=100861 RepID=A0A6G0XPK9_9STRA|nr:hypothetical protein Ae201684_002554 [Aphanomyces euteiches]KAH9092542.1 hypothetical protein Ae201684P_008217 [Aphanomyces euteiches]KAH9146319.1 hypothetical protein AeRB84_009797 [Aphanomyces euteiches]